MYGIRRGNPLDVENYDGKSWSVMVDAFHFYRIVFCGEVEKLRSTKFSKSAKEEWDFLWCVIQYNSMSSSVVYHTVCMPPVFFGS